MSNSFKGSESIIEKMIDFYDEFKTPTSNEAILFFAKGDHFSLTIYKNQTILFQGENADYESQIWNENVFENHQEEEMNIFDHMGSDEVGCGDYFAPIVVCAAYVKESDYDNLKKMGVKDSKQLNDQQIKQIATSLMQTIPYASFVLSNKKYNEIHDFKKYNLNKIKAYLHNFVLFNLKEKYHLKCEIIIDQFCRENLYYSYLKEFDQQKTLHDIYFTTKAENKYLAVACASIIARYLFLQEVERIEKEFQAKLPLGSTKEVDQFGVHLVTQKGWDYVKDFVKFHYKNTDKINEIIQKNTHI